MVAKLFRCIILGAPGSGKGTVAGRIVRDFGMKHLSCGDLLRAEIRQNTDLGKLAQTFISAGQLAPDELVAQITLKRLKELAKENWLLDGFPRTVKQAQTLIEHAPPDAVISLEVPVSVIIERLTKRWIHEPSGRVYNLDFNPPKQTGLDDTTGEPLIQRVDDRPETVKKRLDSYKQWEMPVEQYFAKMGLVKRFHGKTTNEIWPSVFTFIAARLTPQQTTDYSISNSSYR